MTYYVNQNSDEVRLPATPTKDGKVRGGDPEGGRVLVLVLNHLGVTPSVMEVGGVISKFFFNPLNLKITLTITKGDWPPAQNQPFFARTCTVLHPYTVPLLVLAPNP
jgi:hypothetical protein